MFGVRKVGRSMREEGRSAEFVFAAREEKAASAPRKEERLRWG